MVTVTACRTFPKEYLWDGPLWEKEGSRAGQKEKVGNMPITRSQLLKLGWPLQVVPRGTSATFLYLPPVAGCGPSPRRGIILSKTAVFRGQQLPEKSAATAAPATGGEVLLSRVGVSAGDSICHSLDWSVKVHGRL